MVKKLLDSRDPPRFHGDTFAAFNSFTSCLRIRQSVGWYAANDGSIRSKGTVYFVLHLLLVAESQQTETIDVNLTNWEDLAIASNIARDLDRITDAIDRLNR